jgi:hypothetical protein
VVAVATLEKCVQKAPKPQNSTNTKDHFVDKYIRQDNPKFLILS